MHLTGVPGLSIRTDDMQELLRASEYLLGLFEECPAWAEWAEFVRQEEHLLLPGTPGTLGTLGTPGTPGTPGTLGKLGGQRLHAKTQSPAGSCEPDVQSDVSESHSFSCEDVDQPKSMQV